MPDPVVFTFSAGWGLPSQGPFALKLLKWLDLAGIAYVQKFEDLPQKGPKGKNPWIELDGERIGDSEVIIDLLARRNGFDIDAGLGAEERARAHAIRRMLEDHFHMVLEWELFVHPAGAAEISAQVASAAPPLVARAVSAMMCRHFRRQLHARGMARHPEEIIRAKGIADMEDFETLLGDRPFIGGSRPVMADVTAFGLIAPMAKWPMHTPVADYIKTRPTLVAYVERMLAARSPTAAAA